MALIGVIAGIHGNSEALGAVLAAFERRQVSRVVCAGDVVGYNADPAECAMMLRDQRVVCVAGLNDLIAVGRLGYHGCSNRMMHSLKRTRRSLAPQAEAWLRGLPTHQLMDARIALVHGGMREVQQPMASADDVRANAEFLRYDFPGARICFFGRGDAPQAFEVDGNVIRPLRLPSPASGRSLLHLNRELLHFIHPGCVDAQSQREPARARVSASGALFDTLEWTIELLQVPYDAASTEAKAAVFGYRMNGWTSGLYAFKRRILRMNSEKRINSEKQAAG